MSERRKSIRTRARLNCEIQRGRDRLSAKVLDVSDGGLCVLSPIEIEKGESLNVVIDIPTHGPAKIQADVWHVRRVKVRSTGQRLWSMGMILLESDDIYARLFAPVDLDLDDEDGSDGKADELQVYRVRVQERGRPRSRLLTLVAASEMNARELALADIDGSWTITEVLVAKKS